MRTTTTSNSSLNSELEGRSSLLSSYSEWLQLSEGQSSMPYWYSLSKAVLSSRCTSLLRGLLLWSLRVTCLAGAFLYIACSFASDYQYAQGMRTHEDVYILRAAALFPLMRDRRSGPAYLTILRHDLAHLDWITKALKDDPHAADLYFGLASMRLNVGDVTGYNVALTQLQKLTPGVEYRIVQPSGG